MISITSYAKGKKSSQSSGNGGGGGFANAQIYNNGFNPFYLWGQYVDGRDSINGDLISNGTINGNKFVGQQGNIDLIYALSEYVNYISGHTAVFDNLSGDTAHFNQDVYVGGDIDIVGDTNITGDTTIYGDLAVSGDTHLKDVWTQNINNSDTIKTKNLEVTGLAHFFQLVIDRIKAAGGAILLTPADGFETALVEEDASGYTLYFHAKDGEKQISNMWEVNDQAICQTFNASTGTSYNVSNTYYWALVTEVSEQAVQKTVSGVTEEYHYIKLSKSVYDGELNPKVGDEIAMLGSRNNEDPQRQSAIYMAAYTSLDQGLTAPCFAEYKGINDFSLSSHRHSYIDATGASFTGDFRIDNNTTIQDYVNSATTEIRNEFRFDTEGLYSRVSKMTNPNILPANGWTDQDDKALLQEDDEEYIFEEPQQQSMAKGGFSEDVVSEDLIGMPPIIYLNADTYTFSIYSQVKFEDIQYGYTKDNLNMTLPVQTAFNSGDTWHSQARAITTFIAPIDGYYHLGAKMMDDSYTGDYEWVDPDGESGYTPSESAITTTIHISMNQGTTILINSTGNKATATITPSDFAGSVVWASSNPNAATIDQQGNITIVGTGTTTISASIPEQYHNGKHYLGSTDSLPLAVTDQVQTEVTFEPVGNVIIGDKVYFNVYPTSMQPTVAVNNTSVTPTSEGSGRYSITLANSGQTEVVANIASGQSGEIKYLASSAYTTINVGSNIVNIHIDYVEPNVDVETTCSLEATSTPSYPLTYSSSNPSVATVDSNGVISGVSTGSTTITISAITTEQGNLIYNGASIEIPVYVMPDSNYFVIAATSGNPTVTLTKNTGNATDCYYRKNSDEIWTEVVSGTTDIPMQRGEYVELKATVLCYCKFSTDIPNSIDIGGWLMPMARNYPIYDENESWNGMDGLSYGSNSTAFFDSMFKNCKGLRNAQNLKMSSETQKSCYHNMFAGCSCLKTAPKLPSMKVAISAYAGMFNGCTSLTTAPELPATDVRTSAYEGMFWGCSSLKTAPTVLPCNLREIQEQEYNYWSPSNAYNSMFYGCKSLTTGPFLPAAPPPFSSNYKDMFRFCYSLTNFGTYYYGLYMESNYKDFQNWLQGIQTTGTLYCRVDAVFSESDIHLPSTWTLSKTLEIPPTQIISHNPLPQSGLTEDDIFNLNPVSNVSGVTFTYSSSNPTVASVDSSGVISALASGTTTITINASYWYDSVNRIFYKGTSESVTVNVTAYPNRVISAQTITYTPLPESGLAVGDTHSFNASALGTINCYQTGFNIRFLDDDTISGVSAGSTSVIIEAREYIDRVTHVYYPSASTEINVTVWATSAQTISYTALPSSGLTEGETHNLNASAQGTLSYTSSNPSVATVSSNGIISALTSGNTTITITASAYDDSVNFVHYTSATTSVSLTVQESQPFNPLTDSKYFVIQARSATTLTIESVSSPSGTTAYRKNGVGEWTTANIDANTDISLNQGDYLEFKGNIHHANDKYYRFKTSVAKSIDCGGWLAALEKNAEIDSSNNTVTHAFCCLFSGCTGLVNAQDLKLPENTTENMCRTFFRSCTNLVTAPTLPANGTIAVRAYQYMFADCTSLTTAPVLPASAVSHHSYYYMFSRCINLVTPPDLPATTLGTGCYGYMFSNCWKLESAPDLPATTLAQECYNFMFQNCSKLVTGPYLPSKKLAWYCYRYMFYGCRALTSLRVGLEQINTSAALDSWLGNINTTGVCYCPTNAEYSASDISLPSTWTLSKTL